MFGFFKKKRSPIDAVFASLDERSIKVLGSVAKMLQSQLLTSKSSFTYEAKLQSAFVRGYLFGFMDAALQKFELPHTTQDDAILRIIAGHSFVLHDTDLDAIQFVKDSVALQDHTDYKAAHKVGVSELFACFKDDGRAPLGLLRYFVDEVPVKVKPRFHCVDGAWVEKV